MTRSHKTLNLLRDYESRNVTFQDPEGGWPIVWERAQGVYVWDADGKKYLDLTAAFGVATAGHANPRVVAAGRKQMGKLLHAMGDVHPHRLKAELARELSRITFERWAGTSRTGKTIFCNSGFEAVEAALKTALLASGKNRVIAFENAYHGLGYGALNATHRQHFRSPFRRQLADFADFVPFPQTDGNLPRVEQSLRAIFRKRKTGAVLVEPIQVRGGINIPPRSFLPLLRKLCDEFDMLLVLDEVFTGFGRTGKWFACEHSGVVPDLICLGKALTGGFPLSACVGRADLMDAAWPTSSGEAIHTSTFLGHPVGCAMALANIAEIRRKRLVEQSARLGDYLLNGLCDAVESQISNFKFQIRGQGLTVGIELQEKNGAPATAASLQIIKEMLHRGLVLLPEGEHANIVSFTPPLTISRGQLDFTLKTLKTVLLGISPDV
jgi:4-aminobutyrate aminotransferase-like enzyme